MRNNCWNESSAVKYKESSWFQCMAKKIFVKN